MNQMFNKAKEIYRTIKNIGKPKFTCPLCNYHGIFKDVNPPTGYRKYCLCPQCGSAERHRLQKMVLDKILENHNYSQSKILHFAPESFFRQYLIENFNSYVSADLCMDEVDVQCDMTNLPFADQEFDFVFASHVLEHIKDDIKALTEIKRILKPQGIAILPVPVVSELTIEYPKPNPHESDHVRAPGKDYFERYKQVFSTVTIYCSSDFPKKYQPFLYEDRSHYPNEMSPLRQPSYEQKYDDFVPVCIP
jgi:predicted SAM-dependent methyltransferase